MSDTSLVTWQDRLRAEHKLTANRVGKLRAFIYTADDRATPEFQALPTEDRDDLLEQLMHMEGYENVLARRVSRLGPE